MILTDDKLIYVLDANGLRPLCFGQLEDGFTASSESCALFLSIEGIVELIGRPTNFPNYGHYLAYFNEKYPTDLVKIRVKNETISSTVFRMPYV